MQKASVMVIVTRPLRFCVSETLPWGKRLNDAVLAGFLLAKMLDVDYFLEKNFFMLLAVMTSEPPSVL